jgi:hypothetical protein
MHAFNEWLKQNASPPMTVLDTSDAKPSETVAAVAASVRQRLSG